MRTDPEPWQRKSIRLPGRDYRADGMYFVTIVCEGRRPILSDVRGGHIALSPIGEIVTACWLAIPNHFRRAKLDAWVVMPDHVHGIITLVGEPPLEADALAGEDERACGTHSGSVSAIIQNFKAVSTRRINAMMAGNAEPGKVWQRGYYERIARENGEIDRIRRYIRANPARWRKPPRNT